MPTDLIQAVFSAKNLQLHYQFFMEGTVSASTSPLAVFINDPHANTVKEPLASWKSQTTNNLQITWCLNCLEYSANHNQNNIWVEKLCHWHKPTISSICILFADLTKNMRGKNLHELLLVWWQAIWATRFSISFCL